ncbi:mechanosensitive ion channel family protein [Thiomicrorhabdus lithotrophica]|uniref:Small-conductance mechanosensitive channel n=1 Tax=Thiomicrorhabdus lithotrophica TaxID=2949997 RepID=A0ABY8C986_9GAMM|nr:mechanosensitive ion channel domain-containing protein [Thiomicrorhabdus lithotrophica]WEJ62534.1 mechanosensitive ion channel [Thiomicrorhabdus lithotrophica]
MNINEVKEHIEFTWGDFYNDFLALIPDIFVALSILLIGYLLAIFVRKIGFNLFKKLKFDCVAERIGLDKKIAAIGVKQSPSQLLASLFFWLIMLFTFITAAEYAGLTGFVDTLTTIAMYIPNLMAALIILVVGLFVAHFIRNGLQTSLKNIVPAAAKLMANFVYGLLVVIIVLTVLEQLSFDTSLIQTLILVAFTGFALAIALAMGIGSAPQLKKILSSYYLKEHIKVNDTITVDGKTGMVKKINGSSTEIDTGEELLIIPNDQLLDQTYSKKNL